MKKKLMIIILQTRLIYTKQEPLKMNPWTMLKKWTRLEKMQQNQPPDELGQVLVDSQRDCETLKESKKFEKMLEDHKKIIVSRLQAGA